MAGFTDPTQEAVDDLTRYLRLQQEEKQRMDAAAALRNDPAAHQSPADAALIEKMTPAGLASFSTPPPGGRYPVTPREAAEFERTRRMADREGPRRAAYNAARRTADLMAGVGGTSGAALDSALASKARNIDELKAIMDMETLQRNKPNIDTRMAPHTPFYWHGSDRFHQGEPTVVHHEGQEPWRREMTNERVRRTAHEQMRESFRFRPEHMLQTGASLTTEAPGDAALPWDKLHADVDEIYGDKGIPPELMSAIARRDRKALAAVANDIDANRDYPDATGEQNQFARANLLRLFEDTRSKQKGLHKGLRSKYREEHGGMNPDRIAAISLLAARKARMKTPYGEKVQQRLADEREVRKNQAKWWNVDPRVRVEHERGQNAIRLAEAQMGGRADVMQQMEKMQWLQFIGSQPGDTMAEKIQSLRDANIAIPDHIFRDIQPAGGEQVADEGGGFDIWPSPQSGWDWATQVVGGPVGLGIKRMFGY